MINKEIVLVTGCFDLLHVGHVRFLRKASALGKQLIVALASDAYIRKHKGNGRPVVSANERRELLLSLTCVSDASIVDDMDAVIEMAKRLPATTLVIMKDGNKKDEERAQREKRFLQHVPSLKIAYIQRQAGDTSTTKLIARIKELTLE